MLIPNDRNQEECPVQHYLHFERTFIRWGYFYLNGVIFKDKKMFISQKCFFSKRGCTHMGKHV